MGLSSTIIYTSELILCSTILTTEYPGEIEAGVGGEGPRVYASSFSEGRIIEPGSFLCAGYVSTRGYTSKLKLRAAVSGVFSRGTWIIEREVCYVLATRLRVATCSTGVRSVLSWSLDHRTRQFLMFWVRVYAWLRVKIKGKGTGVRGFLSWSLDHRTREFLKCWLRVYAWLRVKNKVPEYSAI